MGRVIGFWEENYEFFNVVLLDPKHNMQPAKDHNYKVNDTSIEHSELESLLTDIAALKGMQCAAEDCPVKIQLNSLPTKLSRGNFVCFQLNEEYYPEFFKKAKNKSIKEIIELGLLSC